MTHANSRGQNLSRWAGSAHLTRTCWRSRLGASSPDALSFGSGSRGLRWSGLQASRVSKGPSRAGCRPQGWLLSSVHPAARRTFGAARGDVPCGSEARSRSLLSILSSHSPVSERQTCRVSLTPSPLPGTTPGLPTDLVPEAACVPPAVQPPRRAVATRLHQTLQWIPKTRRAEPNRCPTSAPHLCLTPGGLGLDRGRPFAASRT